MLQICVKMSTTSLAKQLTSPDKMVSSISGATWICFLSRINHLAFSYICLWDWPSTGGNLCCSLYVSRKMSCQILTRQHFFNVRHSILVIFRKGHAKISYCHYFILVHLCVISVIIVLHHSQLYAFLSFLIFLNIVARRRLHGRSSTGSGWSMHGGHPVVQPCLLWLLSR